MPCQISNYVTTYVISIQYNGALHKRPADHNTLVQLPSVLRLTVQHDVSTYLVTLPAMHMLMDFVTCATDYTATQIGAHHLSFS
jgi:hypothetical protein